ncbi:hypothetical protein BDF22DRAFT_661740 [Syncephalis plumigaleata]|nr:hypothetical protein BDF22DRAFT_661740 [Syncephalis plumigaleata]
MLRVVHSSTYSRVSSLTVHRRLVSSYLHKGGEKTAQSATRIGRSANATHDYRVFDRDLKREQRNRAANLPETSRDVDYLKDDVAASMVDRLLDIKRAGYIAKHLPSDKCDRLIMTDTAEKMLYRDISSKYPVTDIERRIVDEELVPFEENTADAIVSCLSLHWVNDLLGAMIQAQRTLKPDGLFMAALIGGDSLYELRTSFQLAEMEREGGISPRVSPMAGNGFTMTTVDVDEIVVNYPTPFHLMADLRAMGESNAVLAR